MAQMQHSSMLPACCRGHWSGTVPRPIIGRQTGVPSRAAHVILHSSVKEERKTTSGKKGDERGTTSSQKADEPGTRSGTTSSRKTTSGRKDAQRPRSPSPLMPDRRPPNGDKQKPSKLDLYVRQHPVLSRFYDTTLILGDAVMIAATEASSERIEFADMPVLIGVMVAAWVAAGAWNGDYRGRGSQADAWYVSMLGPAFQAVINATVTWAFAATASIAVYSYMVAHNELNAAPLVEGINTEDMSPQLEVVVALLITMCCWRGIASKLRNY